MNLKIILAVVLLAAAAAVGVTSFKKTMTPYIGFAEARTASGLVQVNGKLADKDYVLKAQEQFLRFNLRDEQGTVMPVEYRGVIPGNFDQAVSVVAIGKYQGDHFEAQQLLVKCPSKYQAEADKAAKGKTS
ncbi:MAG TPA: cytochrome c maturation protein CcmE [Verrucomicrobiae bacterium]|jgi:cytochrome c-type biogenesis protein CcmE|nr:cytochrome c maturation protein CcmE [Verrucomicrobiae bacterium]